MAASRSAVSAISAGIWVEPAEEQGDPRRRMTGMERARSSWRWGAGALALVVSVAGAKGALAADPVGASPAKTQAVAAVAPPLPLSIAVVTADGKTAQTRVWIDAQVAEAQRIYGKLGVSFRAAEVRRLSPRFAKLETKADRDALAGELKPGVINVFVVGSLRDVDDPTIYRMGVHWAPNGNLKKQYVIVSAAARKTTLAHEVGHYFSLQHTDVTDNLMSYKREGPDIVLNLFQQKKVIASVKGYVAKKELVPTVE